MKTSSTNRPWLRLALTTLVSGACLLGGATALRAQGGPPGNFDPAQMRQRMLERLREQFEVKDEAEWKILSTRIENVMNARRSLIEPMGPGGFGVGGPGGPPPRPDGAGIDTPPGGPEQPGTPEAAPGPGAPAGQGGFQRASSPEAEALRKALEAKATSAELKAKLAEFRAARQRKEADLAKAQAELTQVLTVRQEAVAVMAGLLK